MNILFQFAFQRIARSLLFYFANWILYQISLPPAIFIIRIYILYTYKHIPKNNRPNFHIAPFKIRV